MKYSQISSLEELEKERLRLRSEEGRQKKNISDRFDKVKQSTTTANLFGAALRTYSDKKNIPYDRFLLKIVRRLINRVKSL